MKTKNPTPNYYKQESDRLLFRRMDLTDVVAWTPFFIDNPTQRFVGGFMFDISPAEKANNWILKQLDREANGEYGQLAVIDKTSNEFIGVGGIISREFDEGREFEITYSLLPTQWGKGYATELAVHFKKYAQRHIECDSVISIIHIENEASMNVARKNRMSPERETTYLDMPVYIFRTSFH